MIEVSDNRGTLFAQFEPGKSLIFYYAGYSNPFCENEENNYVVVGISRVTNDADMKTYRDDVRCFLNGEIEEVSGNSFSKAEARRIRREYQLMGSKAAFLSTTSSICS